MIALLPSLPRHDSFFEDLGVSARLQMVQLPVWLSQRPVLSCSSCWSKDMKFCKLVCVQRTPFGTQLYMMRQVIASKGIS